jgi:hypothetical protein
LASNIAYAVVVVDFVDGVGPVGVGCATVVVVVVVVEVVEVVEVVVVVVVGSAVKVGIVVVVATGILMQNNERAVEHDSGKTLIYSDHVPVNPPPDVLATTDPNWLCKIRLNNTIQSQYISPIVAYSPNPDFFDQLSQWGVVPVPFAFVPVKTSRFATCNPASDRSILTLFVNLLSIKTILKIRKLILNLISIQFLMKFIVNNDVP